MAGLTVAVEGEESSGIVGRNSISAADFGLFGQLQFVGKVSKLFGGNVFAEGPNKVLGGFAVTVGIIKPEGGLGCAGSSEGVGATKCGVCYHSGSVTVSSNNKLDAISIFYEFEVAVLVLSDIVYNPRSCGAGVDHIVVNGGEEVFLQGGHRIVVIAFVSLVEYNLAVCVTEILPDNGSLTLT